MLKINKHIDEIVARCVTDKTNRNYECELGEGDNFVSIRAIVPPKEGEHPGFHRYVKIMAEVNKEFWIEFKEVSLDPVFVTQEQRYRYPAQDVSELASACRFVYFCINGKVHPHFVPPAKYVELRDKINKEWFSTETFQVQLFLQGGEFGDDWRFRIVHKNGMVIIGSLDPDTADGHTYRMASEAVKDAFDRGVEEGAIRAAERITTDVFKTALGVSDHNRWRLPQEIGQLIQTNSIPRDRKVI